MLCYHTFNWMKNDMLTLTPMSEDAYLLLKFAVLPFCSLALAAVYFFASNRLSTYQIAKKTYQGLIIFVALFAIILIPMYLKSPPSVDYSNPVLELGNKWILTLFYTFVSLWTPITLLTFYGYTNQRFTFREAAKIYPTLAIIGLIFSQLIIPTILPLAAKKNSIAVSYIPAFIAITILWVTRNTFMKMEQVTQDSHNPSSYKTGYSFVIMLSFLSISVGFAKYISLFSLGSAVELHRPFQSDYWHTMDTLTSLKALSNFMAILILAFLSVYLQQHRIKGWKHFCFAGATVTSFITLTLVLFSFFGEQIQPLLSKTNTSSLSSTIIKVGNSYQIFVSTVIYPTFFCLMQLAFIPINSKHRFKVKILIDMILYNAGFIFAVLIQKFLQPDEGAAPQFLIYFAAIFFIGTALRFYTINYVSKRLELSEV